MATWCVMMTGGPGTGDSPTETACVQVKPGEKVELPRGGTVNGRPVPKGPFSVPDPIPGGGVLVGIACTTGEPLVVSESCVAFAAPEAGPGKGEVQVTQAGKTESYPVEAVAPQIARDCPDANVGDIRVLSDFAGTGGEIARFEALAEGKMTAVAKLKAVRR